MLQSQIITISFKSSSEAIKADTLKRSQLVDKDNKVA